MPEPSGNLVTPVGLNAEGLPRAGNLPFTYHSQVMGKVGEDNAAAGYNVLESGAVPAGYIWVITSIEAHNTNNAVTYIRLGVKNATDSYWTAATGVLAATVGFSWSGVLCLIAGDSVVAAFNGCTLNDNIRLHYFGYIMEL